MKLHPLEKIQVPVHDKIKTLGNRHHSGKLPSPESAIGREPDGRVPGARGSGGRDPDGRDYAAWRDMGAIFVRGGTRSARGRGYLWTNAMRRPPVDDLRDFIDPDEGRDTDWDSHLNVPEPFYTEALPCESCGKPVDGERRASWDESLLVGPCCASDVPESIRDPSICMDLYRIQMACQTVGELCDESKAHRLVCRVCNPGLPEELKEAA